MWRYAMTETLTETLTEKQRVAMEALEGARRAGVPLSCERASKFDQDFDRNGAEG
jgi:hypothetical protein